MNRIAIVIPTYNEEETIGELLCRLDRLASNVSQTIKIDAVLVVDDASPDKTGSIIRAWATTHATVQLLPGPGRGFGPACLCGLRAASGIEQVDTIILMDGDMSHDPSIIPLLVKRINSGHDLVIGSRYVRGGAVDRCWPVSRRVNSLVANWLTRRILGVTTIRDCTSGFRAFNTDAVRHLSPEHITARGYGFQVQCLHAITTSGGKVAEIPIHFADRQGGKSKLRMNNVLEFIRILLGLRNNERRLRLLRQSRGNNVVE